MRNNFIGSGSVSFKKSSIEIRIYIIGLPLNIKDAKLVVDGQHTRKPRSKDLDELDIVATAFLILVAGYDTTSQTLAYAGESSRVKA